VTLFNEIRLVLFIVATVFFISISRRTLLNFRPHGFCRFITWESIAALVISNLPQWYTDPFFRLTTAVMDIVVCVTLFALARRIATSLGKTSAAAEKVNCMTLSEDQS